MSSKNVVDLRNKKPVRKEEPTLFSTPAPERSGKRVSLVRARRRRTRLIIAIVIIILLAVIAFGISWVSYLPRYSVQSVSIVGAQQVPSSDIYDYVESVLHDGQHPYLSKDNIFLYNPGAIGREVVGYFPRIASATVSRTSLFSTTITVTVGERQPYAVWCTDDTETDCYEMDNGGFIFAQAPAGQQVVSQETDASSTAAASSTLADAATSTPMVVTTASPVQIPPGQFVFEGGVATSTVASSTGAVVPISPIGQTFSGSHMASIVAFLELLGQAGFSPTGAIVQDDQDFWVPLTAGFYIKASFGEDPQDLVSNLQLVLSSDALQGKQSDLDYVDLRFGDRVYYKLQGQDEAQTPSS